MGIFQQKIIDFFLKAVQKIKYILQYSCINQKSLLKYQKIIILFTINIALISFSCDIFAQNIDNRCSAISKSKTKLILRDLNIGKFDITELSFCQKRSYNLFIELIKINPDYLIYADDTIKSDQLFIKSYVKEYPEILKYITFDLRLNKIFFKEIAQIYPDALEYAAIAILDNNAFMRDLIDINSKNFLYASERLRGDFEFVLSVVRKDGDNLKYASDKLRDNRKIVIAAINSYLPAANYASFRLKNKDEDIKNLLKSFQNAKFLNNIESFLRNQYSGILVGPNGSRGYRIVNQAKYLKQKALINKDDYLRWRSVSKSKDDNKIFITATDLKRMSWKFDLKEYPKLTKKIDKILNKYLDKKTADGLFVTSMWQISKNPEILVIDLDLVRNIRNIYNKSTNSNTSYVTLIAFTSDTTNDDNINDVKQNGEEEIFSIEDKKDKAIESVDNKEKKGVLKKMRNILTKKISKDKELPEDENLKSQIDKTNNINNAINKEWFITIISSNFDVDLKNNILFEDNRKSYEFWDIYNQNNLKDPAIIFKVEDRNSEYFEIFFRQINNRYYKLYKGGGYNFDILKSAL